MATNAASALKVRVVNNEKDLKTIEYRKGPAPKAGEKDTRPRGQLVLGSTLDKGRDGAPQPEQLIDADEWKHLLANSKAVAGWIKNQQVQAFPA